MRTVVVAFAVGAVLLLVACGSSAVQTDPFVGTWRPADGTSGSSSVVIVKGSDGYEAFIVSRLLTNGPLLLQRHAYQLVFPAQNGIERQTFTFDGESGRLTYKDGSAKGIEFELPSRRSSHPTPQPPNPSPDESL